MADTQDAPQLTGENMPGSIREAQEALLGIMEPEEDKPKKEEAEPTEAEESQPETEESSYEEESESEESLEAQEERAVEGEDTEEETDDEATEEPSLYSVTIDGDEVEVSLDELMKGYSRQSDYTRKTQQLSDNRREFESMQQHMAQEYQQIQAERQYYADTLQNVIDASVVGLEKYSSIDWDNLRENDPVAFVTKKEEFREAQEKLNETQFQQQEAVERQQFEYQNQLKQSLAQEHKKMIDIIPDWGVPEKQKAMASSLRDYAISQGYSAQEVSSLADHRSLIVLLKAQHYDSLQQADVKTKKLKNKPKVVRSGKGKTQNESSKSKRVAQMKRLQQSGHVKDATSLFEDFVDL
jgi:hypothetical protein